VNEEGQKLYEASMREYLRARVSRAQLLKASAAGLAAAAIPGAAAAAGGTTVAPGYGPGQSFPYFPQTNFVYTTESVGTIINIADTAEHLAITFLSAGIANAATIGLSGVVLQIVQAALAEEVYHVEFLEAAGARSLTDTFTVPDPKMLTDYATFFKTVEIADTLFNAAYMAATREFAELGQPTLAKIAYQIGSVEAEHRTLARAALALKGVAGSVPPNNKGFETDLLVYVADAAKILTDLGFFGGSGTKATYPGTAAALATANNPGVIQTLPNNATASPPSEANLTGAVPVNGAP